MIHVSFIHQWINKLDQFLESLGMLGATSDYVSVLIILIGILLASYLVDLMTKRILLVTAARFIKKSKIWWDDILLRKKVFNRLAHYAPALVIYFAAGLLKEIPILVEGIQLLTTLYMIGLGILVIDSIINGFHEIYSNLPIGKERPIKGFVQILKILLYFIGVIFMLSVIFNKNPFFFLTGLGAMAAVLILVFKDTILGFVASIQLTANDMIKLGDWITMPSHHADGVVYELTLNTVKVRNFDKTISTIPTYALVSESFNNWRGMKESGGRRIKRSLYIDMKSICFCTDAMLQKYQNIRLISDYIMQIRREIEEDNRQKNLETDDMLNGRRLTNVGVFRKYVEAYIRNHPKIYSDNSSFALLVRQLQSTEMGLPLEIYAFSKEQDWSVYEGIQADIFDHLMAVISEFDLRIYQSPTGEDFQRLLSQ